MRLCHFIAMTTSRAIFALLGISFSSGKQCLVIAIFMIGVIYVFWGWVIFGGVCQDYSYLALRLQLGIVARLKVSGRTA